MAISAMPRSTAWRAYSSMATSLSGDRSVCRWASSGRSRPWRSRRLIVRPPAARSSRDEPQLATDRGERLEGPVELLVGVGGGHDRADAGLVHGHGREDDR